MKKLINIFVVLILALGLTSCYEESDWFDDNVTTEGKHFPVIATTGLDNEPAGDFYAAGETIELALYYWSIETIDKVTLTQTIDGVATEVDSKPYAANFDEVQQCDKMNFSYIVPSDAGGKVITMTFTVINANGLTREKTRDIEIM